MRISLLAAALATSSCSVLPPSLRAEPEAPKPVGTVMTPAQVAAAAGLKPATTPPAADAKLYPGSGTFVVGTPSRPTVPGPEEASLNFEALDVREVAKVILGDYLKQSYTVHPSVTGTVTFRTVRPISIKDLLPTLEMLLRQNNAAVVVEEGIYKILPISAVRGSVSPQLGGTPRPIPPGFSVLVVPLKYVSAREMQKLLEPFAADNTVRIDEVRNLVIIAGNQRELQHLVDTVDLFDVDWLSGYSVGLFPIKGADVKGLVADLDRVFGAGAQSPLAGIVRVIPIERMNALLVITTQARYLNMAKTWIERIDQAGGAGAGSRIHVYQVRNSKAENLAQLIGDLFSSRRTSPTAPALAPGSRPGEIRSGQPAGAPASTAQATTAATFQMPGGTGATASEVRVIADKDTNSLLIVAAPADYEVIEDALKKLDVVRRQVLVEVLLAEVTLADGLEFGIDWFLTARNNTSGTLNTMGTLPASRTGTVAGFGGLQLIQLTGNEIRAVLRTLGSDGKTKVVAAPQVMVLDNEKAEIKIGDRISVQTQSQTGVSTGTGVLNSFQYLETGVLLAVTPRINSGGMVTLEINQEVSQAKNPTGAGNPNPDVGTRSAKTSVVVGSGESVVLGGLIREENTRTSIGVPLLSKIPLLGALFGYQTLDMSRTELVMVVTPKIVNDTAQARQVTEELKRKLPSLEGLLPKLPPPQPADASPQGPSLGTPPPPASNIGNAGRPTP
ncbi:MAG TPA: type II secretion system secretin GspD [Usitatibacter sp.]|nr:type II secretion system secretin GspD [Usitatibacter sp.]